jgi:glycosyltransferase involved in cell wall biosynthesis
MTNNILISVIVPVYNVEEFLGQCVDSLIGQTFREFEVILVDDGSTDNSLKICNQYAKKDKRIKVIHQTNGRQTKARKTGLAASNGQYVYFVDSDDWLEPELLEIAYNAAKKDKSDVVIFDSYFNYDSKQIAVNQPIPSGVFNKSGLIEKIYPRMIYSGRFFYFGVYAAMWPKLIKKSLAVPNLMNVDEKIKLGEDGVTSFAVMLDAKKVSILKDQHLYHYRDNNASLTRSYCSDQFDSVVLLVNTLRKISKQKAIYDLNEQIDYYFMYNIHCIYYEEFFYKSKKSYTERFRYLRIIFDNKQVKQAVKNISIEGMPTDSRRFFVALKKGNFKSVLLLSIIEGYRKRVKLQIKKVLKRY